MPCGGVSRASGKCFPCPWAKMSRTSSTTSYLQAELRPHQSNTTVNLVAVRAATGLWRCDNIVATCSHVHVAILPSCASRTSALPIGFEPASHGTAICMEPCLETGTVADKMVLEAARCFCHFCPQVYPEPRPHTNTSCMQGSMHANIHTSIHPPIRPYTHACIRIYKHTG